MRFPILALLACLAAPAAAQDRDPPPVPRDSAEVRRDSAAVADEARAVLDTLEIDGEPTYEPIETITWGAAPWQVSYFPYLTGGSNDGPMLAFRVRWWKPAEYEDRVTSVAAVSVDAGIGGQGSRFLTVRGEVPRLALGWRGTAMLGAIREGRYGFYGLGNDTERDDDLVDDEQPYYYKVRRNRLLGMAEVSREVLPAVYVSFLGGAERAHFSTLPGPSVFRDVYEGDVTETDGFGRFALIYDTRDNEFNPHRGVLLEGGLQAGSGGDGYTRLYVTGKGYLPVSTRMVLAGRVLMSGMGGDPSLNARMFIPLWEDPLSVYGGGSTNRGLDKGRYTGRHLIFLNAEARYDLLRMSDFAAIGLLAFVDAGRVAEDEFVLTTSGMHVGAGGGVTLRLLRSTIFTLTVARGSDGVETNIGSGWMF